MKKGKICLKPGENGSFGFGTDEFWFEQAAEGFSAELRETESGAEYRLTDAEGRRFGVKLTVLENGVELVLTGGECPKELRYPGPTAVQPGDRALLPIGEGMLFPVDDPTIRVLPEVASGWSPSQSMGMIGLIRGDAWLVTAVEDASGATVYRTRAENGLLQPHIRWMAERGGVGYPRAIRYLFGETGGVAAACRAYREYRQAQGLAVTLREKMKQAPQIEKLIGAADVWLWHDDYEKAMYSDSTAEYDLRNADEVIRVAREMKAGGMERAIFGMFFRDDCAASAELGKLGYLVTKYDNYSDLLPATLLPKIPKLRVEQCDYTIRRTKNWPQDVVICEDGTMCPAWALRGTDGVMHPQNSMCARQAAVAAREEVGEYARKYGCDAWFIDVLGGGIGECHSPVHPTTRREDRACRLDALQTMLDSGLVSGTEEGVECFVPALCYAEGRMSPQQYRINYLESGRHKGLPYTAEEHEECFDRYMLNPEYRVPLWELVYHDCNVSYWYWGDSSNCCPEALPRRDLFNALYGTPPLYSLHTAAWDGMKDEIMASCARATAVAKRVGLEPMTDFVCLTPDRQVQRTVFGDGTVVTANFSDAPYAMEDGTLLPPGEYRMTEA